MTDQMVFASVNMSDGCYVKVRFRLRFPISSHSFTKPFQLNRTAEYDAQTGILPTPLIVLCSIPIAIIILLTVLGNLLVLSFKARVGRTNTTLLVWNLGLTDFLVGIVVLPFAAFHLAYRKWIFGRFWCRVWIAADVTFCTCSVVTICVISIDRYLAVTRPLHYKSLVTKTKVIIVLISIWMFSWAILLTTLRWEQPQCYDHYVCFAGNEIRYLAHSVIFAFFLPASVTLTLYWRIYKLARKRQQALDRGFLIILSHGMNFFSNTLTQQSTLRVHFGKNMSMLEDQRHLLRSHERIAKTLGVVSCSFLFCWLPFFSLYLISYCNSMLNPIIYSFTIKEYKRSAQRLVIPTWQIVYRCLPKFIPPPPDLHTKRFPHYPHRFEEKTRHKSSELNSKEVTIIATRDSHKRHQTEPLTFGKQKVCDATSAAFIINDNDDAKNEYTKNNTYTTYNGSSIHLPDLSTGTTLSNAGNENTTMCNGEHRFYSSTDSSCVITVFYDTSEAYI